MKNTFKRMNYPVYLAFTGAVLSAIGAYWLSRDQANESDKNSKLYKQLADKSNEIAEYAKKQERASEENAKLYRQLAEQSSEIAGYARKQERASEEVKRIQQKLAEKADVQIHKTEEIAKLNADLAESQREIAKISKDITNNVTGGDSFCYMTLSSMMNNKIGIYVSHQGKYPLNNLKMLITNLSAVDRIAGNNGPMRRAMGMFRQNNATVFEVGNLPPSPRGKFVDELNESDNGWTIDDSYYVEFFANNGPWVQQYKVSNTKGFVERSIEVFKDGKTVFEHK